MKQKTSFAKTLCGGLVLVSALFTAGCSSGNPGGNCVADFFVAESWNSAFRCQDSNASFGCFTGTDMLTVTQDGTAAQPGSKVSFTDNNGGSFSGQLCGSTFTWSGTGPGINESGTWEFSDAQNFTKTTDYDRTDGTGGGDCEGDGAEASLPTPIPPAC